MKNRKNIVVLLNFISGFCFLLAAVLGKNHVFFPLGCCFITLGIINHRKNRNDKKDQ